ncbi:MAG: hypothetical protein ACLR5N_04705 [Haemophilus parainfluenzae]
MLTPQANILSVKESIKCGCSKALDADVVLVNHQLTLTTRTGKHRR